MMNLEYQTQTGKYNIALLYPKRENQNLYGCIKVTKQPFDKKQKPWNITYGGRFLKETIISNKQFYPLWKDELAKKARHKFVQDENAIPTLFASLEEKIKQEYRELF